MSTNERKIFIYFFILTVFPFFGLPVFAQPAIEARLKIDALNPQSLSVEGDFLDGRTTAQNKNWSFLNDAENSVERITNFALTDENNRKVEVKKFAAGEYLAEKESVAWKYDVQTVKPQNVSRTARGSWLDGEQGILMLADLLPQFSAAGGGSQPVSARVKFDLPAGWKIISREKRAAENVFEVESVEKAIFLIGKNWREREISIESGRINFAVSGAWRFTDAEAENIAVEIFAGYKKLFGENPNEQVQVALARLPEEVNFGRWQAETRGANLTILASDMPFKTLSLQRLREQLRHELFHLWMPNNLALTGNYDWFYEGFTVYAALKTGVGMNQIRFEDFLDTLSQAYNLDSLQTRKISLLDASKNGASGANPQVYARGMIAAFLADVALLRASRGKRSISNVFQQIYRKHRKPNQPQEANRAVLNVLSEYKELDSIVENVLEKNGKIDWKIYLESAGIEEIEENGFARLGVRAESTGRAKELLDKLGYNNWRKIPVKTK